MVEVTFKDNTCNANISLSTWGSMISPMVDCCGSFASSHVLSIHIHTSNIQFMNLLAACGTIKHSKLGDAAAGTPDNGLANSKILCLQHSCCRREIINQWEVMHPKKMHS